MTLSLKVIRSRANRRGILSDLSQFVSNASRTVSTVAVKLLVPGAEILFSFGRCLNSPCAF